MTKPDRYEKYLRTTRAAATRYTKNGLLKTSIGGKPSRYATIEAAAWRKYIATT